MTDEEQIRQVFQDFEDGGLVSKDIRKALDCISDRIIGIGIGEQGYVYSKKDVREIFESGLRKDDRAKYTLEYSQLEIRIHDGKFANAFGDIIINRLEDGSLTKSRLQQTLVFLKEDGAWKICGLHASAPMITEEVIAAYPLKVAENMLQSLRDEIGEKAFLAEAQFQQAVLADTIAFYIINFSKDIFEKCQVNRQLCAYVEPGTPYEDFMKDHLPDYVAENDRTSFIKSFSLDSIMEAFENNKKELRCEYQIRRSDGAGLWALTVIRLIRDCITGDRKGIMYVKDIDRQKQRELEMLVRAECDDMTELYNRSAFSNRIDQALSGPGAASGAFFMLDVDNFKTINDTLGHPSGDRVLIAVTGILRELFQDTCILGRLGGDEFGVYAPGSTVSELSETRLPEFMERIGGIRITADAGLPLTCSIGLTETAGARSFKQLYLQADKALYRSKSGGKGRCTVYGETE